MRNNVRYSEVRVLTLLSLIEGAIIVAGKTASPVTCNRILSTQRHCKAAVDGWPLVGDERKTALAVVENLKQIADGLNNIWWLKAKPDMNIPGMLYISLQLLDDLMLLITNHNKRIWLGNIYGALATLLDKIDPEGKMFLTQERASEVVRAIYKIVGEQ